MRAGKHDVTNIDLASPTSQERSAGRAVDGNGVEGRGPPLAQHVRDVHAAREEVVSTVRIINAD